MQQSSGCKFRLLADCTVTGVCSPDNLYHTIQEVRCHHLPFGITSAPEHFQRQITHILSGLSGKCEDWQSYLGTNRDTCWRQCRCLIILVGGSSDAEWRPVFYISWALIYWACFGLFDRNSILFSFSHSSPHWWETSWVTLQKMFNKRPPASRYHQVWDVSHYDRWSCHFPHANE